MPKKIDELIQTMDEARPMMGIMLGFDMNYKPQSLKKIEEALYGILGHRPLDNKVIVMLGLYVGETIKRNVKGAEWLDFEEFVMDAFIEIPTPDKDAEIRINSFSRVKKYMDDRTDSIYHFYAMIQDMSKGRLNTNPSKGVQTGKSPRGYEYTITPVGLHLKERFDRGEITYEEMMRLAQEEANN